MHILIAVVTILSAIATWFYRLRRIGRAAGEVTKLAKKARNAPRKMSFKRRARKTGLKAVEDPMEAGAILMVLMAGVRTNKALGAPYRDIILNEMETVFQLDQADAADLVTHAVWMVRDVELVSGVFLRMVDIVKRAPDIGATELVDLYEMLQRVGQADGPYNDEQQHMIGLYCNKIGIQQV